MIHCRMKSMRHTSTRLKREAGFSMVEVLVSLLLMTIGLLGISGLMLSGVNNATGFDLASRASQSANEIIDAMRANSTNAASYVTAYGTTAASLTGTAPANSDRKQWLENVQRLPGGDGQITAVAGSPGEYQVSVRFANCLGSLSAAQLSSCQAVASDNEKRTISFRFRI